MNSSTKRILSTIAIVIASVTFGVLVSADLGLMRQSKAQSASMQTGQGPVTSVTIPSFADVAARAMPAVVSVESTEIVRNDRRRQFGIDPFDFFFPDPRNPNRRRTPGEEEEEEERRQQSGGSGFIISEDGYILTNNHVIEGATKVEVHFGADENGIGGRTVTAKIVGRDPATDIALLKIDADRALPFIPLGDSDRIRKGDWAIAIGNPFSFENTLTVGVISAKGRSLGLSNETRSFENFIQTDAAINFGNSGGPLLNIRGEVIGINTAIRGGGAQGIGFASPINTSKLLLPQLKQGKVTRGYLGIEISDVTQETAEAFGLENARGALVQRVEEGKPAAKAGVQHGDVIVSVDNTEIRTNRDLIDYISYLPVGTEVKLTVVRDGRKRVLTAKTAERPPDGEVDEDTTTDNEPVRNKLGMSVTTLTPQLRELYRIPEDVEGTVVVTNVRDVSAAGEANINEGDVIREVQGQKISSVEDFQRIVDRLQSGQRIRMYVTTPVRQGQVLSGYRILQVP